MAKTLELAVGRGLDPWTAELGADRAAYTNHVLRVLSFCDALSGQTPGDPDGPSGRIEFLTAAIFHDLGVWTSNTFDYLAPSIQLAHQWLTDQRREDLIPLVSTMIDDHHKIRHATGSPPEVELFRRADTVDVTAGLRRFGMTRGDYRTVTRRYPDSGFRRRLAQLAVRRIRGHPFSPLPMVKW
ncbi:phosphohydrolase [Nocardia colli]|uniref:Phosphohydrolase n=1 Tax=Nocardia colli TaxID=2545717 RepID=A0A5N0EB45_9NOCA|nr:phosphohydrolase [Nocardia colli]KAA8885699.1 phosphohydrolase [Nocardia colli]